jgi:hypothetical protein
MADTLIEQVPPTVREERLQPRNRRRLILVALSILAAIVLVLGVAFYLFVWRYEPLARRHIPANASVAMRFEFADVVLFGPVREHLWPLIEARSPARGKTRGEKIREATGVNLVTDLRELVVASVDGASFVAIAGGRIKRGRFVHGLAQVARDEGWAGGWHEVGELLIGPGGVAVGQADDGTIAIGSDANIVTAALPASDESRNFLLPHEGAASFAITKQAWSGAAGKAVVAHASVLRKIERATGRFTLNRSPELWMEIEPAAGNEAPALTGEIEQVLAELRIVTLLVPDIAGEKGALSAVKVSAKGDRVVMVAPWSYEALDRGCARLGGLIQAAGLVIDRAP